MQPTVRRPFHLRKGLLWIGILAAVGWAAWQANLFNRELINPGGWTLVARLINGLFHPDLSLDFLRLTLDSVLITLAYAVLGTFLSLVFGVAGGVLSSEVWWQGYGYYVKNQKTTAPARRTAQRAPWLAMRTLLAVPRSLHEIVWGLIFLNILGLNPLTAILAIAVPFGAICAKVFSEILDEQPRQPFLALLNAGASPLQALLYGLFPQALPNLISYSFYRFECSIRSATVLGVIGAGGLGYQILLSLQSLRYEEFLPLLVALVVLSGLTDLWSSKLRGALGGATRIELQTGDSTRRSAQTSGGMQSPGFIRGSLFLIILLTIFSFFFLKIDLSILLSPRTTNLLNGILRDAFPPRLPEGGIPTLVRLAGQTLAISILAMAAASLFAMLAAFLASKMAAFSGRSTGTPASTRVWRSIRVAAVRLVLLIARAVPTPIWALVILFVVLPGILPGAIALGLHNWGITGRLMTETIDNMDDRPSIALKALGASRVQTFFYGVFPEVFPGFISYTFYRWENCIRETIVVGIVGAGGLGRLLTEQLSNFDFAGITSTIITLIFLTLLVDILSSEVRRTFRMG